jgi:tripartite-type tricarboxylate transporter receptor subunit TctC
LLSTSLFRDLENCFFQDGCDPIAAITACVTDQSLKSRLLNLDVEPTPMSVAEFKKFVAEEIAKYAKVVQFAGIKVE